MFTDTATEFTEQAAAVIMTVVIAAVIAAGTFASFVTRANIAEKQYADLQLFWHYSKDAPKGIRIFGIPLSLILRVVFRPEKTKELYQPKLSKIPKIKATEKNSRYYRIQLKGDINHNKTNLILKEVR